MRAFVIRRSDMLRCPTRRLDVQHFRADGVCRCHCATCKQLLAAVAARGHAERSDMHDRCWALLEAV
jgi:hypothetical protein